jgi:hypothetical protein
VKRLEAFVLRAEQSDLHTRHFIVPTPHGVTLYGREIMVPPQTVITGAASNLDHLVTCTGDILVSTDEGMRRLTGHHTFKARKGAKRVGITFEHACAWTCFYVVKADNVDEIEREMSDEFEMLQTRRGLLLFDALRALGG